MVMAVRVPNTRGVSKLVDRGGLQREWVGPIQTDDALVLIIIVFHHKA